jgi:hypothetical protein
MLMWSKRLGLRVLALLALPLAIGVYWLAVRDDLDGIEHVCLDELLKSKEMAGTTEMPFLRPAQLRYAAACRA